VIASPEGDVPIRTLIAAAVLASAATLASAAFVETHLNEITAPVQTYVTARVATLEALPAPTRDEKRELKLLGKLAKKLGKTQFTLKGDFAELAAAASTAKKLGAAGLPMDAALDEAFARAGLSLSERTELTRDYAAVLTDPDHVAPVLSKLGAASAARTAADAELDLAKRGAGLVKADALVTKALKKADKSVLADRGAEFVPPTRFRSGDLIGPGGGRVAVPRDSGSPIAGASIVIPVSVISSPVAITLASAAGFVGGRDTPAGPAVAIGPDALAFGAPARLYVPYALPDGANADDLAVFAKGPPASTDFEAVAEIDGTLSSGVSSLSTFQAGLAAPPPGQPGGAYHVQTLALFTALDANAQDVGGIVVGALDQTITFRTNHTGSTTPPSYNAISRNFVGAAPHHVDAKQSPFFGSVDFTWTQGAAGRFSYSIPLGDGSTAQVEGVASDDGRVIAISARGGSFEYVGVGVRGGTSAVTADLAGRWAAVELGVELRDDGAEPFTTRWFDGLRTFTVDAQGAVAFAPQGTRFETDVTYRTGEADPVHSRAENVVADSGAETWTVTPAGRVSDATSRRAGWLDSAAGVLVSAFYDAPQEGPATRRVSLMVAVPQADAATPASLPGLYHLAQFEVGTGVASPATTTSSHDTTPSVGSLDVQSATAATLAYEATSRAAYSLAGPPPLTDIAWTMTSAATAMPASSSNLTLALDAAGNHTGLTEERWFAFETQGRTVLGLLRGESTRLARGIAIGLR
jgi:hypothetical protein